MPVKHCCYGCCKSDSRYPERMTGLHFIPFPKPKSQQEKCIRWIKACGRPQFNVGRVNKDTYICSKHFKDSSGPTIEYPDPVLSDETAVRKSRQPKKRRINEKNIGEPENKQLVLINNDNTKETQTDNREYYPLDMLAACVKVTELEDENKQLKEKLEEVSKELEAYKNKEIKEMPNTTIQTDSS